MIRISERQLALFAHRALVASIEHALARHPEHKAALSDPDEFCQFCLGIAQSYKLEDANHVEALVALCLDLGTRRTTFFAQPDIAELPFADQMKGHQRLHLAGFAAFQQGLLRGGSG